MYIVRDIFHLKFGHFRPVKTLMEEMSKNGMMPQGKSNRILSDFTGDAYRVVMETGFEKLDDFEKELSRDMSKPEFQDWYKKFIDHVERSHREIMKVVM
jgi:hypothetical protein